MAGPDRENTSLPQGASAAASQDSPSPGSPPRGVAAGPPESGAAGQPDPTGPAGPAGSAGSAGSSADAARLLVRAVGTLPDAERDQVYAWLLGRAMSGPFGSAQWPGRLREVSSQLLSLQQAGGPPAAPEMGQQMVPVRFSTEQHAQLRTWCSEHGFSMATVIRGLVARFLDGQLPARN
jgi:hypothetical protein